jgi:hypothetical protein
VSRPLDLAGNRFNNSFDESFVGYAGTPASDASEINRKDYRS